MKRDRIPEQLAREMCEAAANISDVAELRAYAGRFPSPEAGKLIIEALDFFAEAKVVNGKRDGKKIFAHVTLGYGQRLKESVSFRPPRIWDGKSTLGEKLLIGIRFYAEKEWPKRHEMTYGEKLAHKKSYGVESPQELVYEFVHLLYEELRKCL